MWNLAKGKRFLPEISLKRLKEFYKTENNAKAKLRLLAAIHRKNSKSIDAICELLEKPKTTIHRWLNNFQKKGIKAKNSTKQPGRNPQLNLTQREKLIKDLERGPPFNKNGLWSTKEVLDLLKKKYGVFFVPQHVWRIITALGFTLQRPRKRHHESASDEEIAEFKKKQNGKHIITERKDLLWAHRMKQHSA